MQQIITSWKSQRDNYSKHLDRKVKKNQNEKCFRRYHSLVRVRDHIAIIVESYVELIGIREKRAKKSER
jgi:hypothetical protein